MRRIREELARFERMFRSTHLDRVVGLTSSSDFGDCFFVCPACDAPRLLRCKVQPEITRLLGRRVKGYDPVFVELDHGGGLRWLPRGAARMSRRRRR
jgi:hypothetical protein